MKLLSRIRGLYRFDGDEEPVLVSRRSFVFLGGVVGVALAIPAAAAALPGTRPHIDISPFLSAMEYGNGGRATRYTAWGDSTLNTTVAPSRWFHRLDPRDPSQWHEVIPSVPRDAGKRIADGVKRHSWTPESWAEHCRRAESLYGDRERSYRRALSSA